LVSASGLCEPTDHKKKNLGNGQVQEQQSEEMIASRCRQHSRQCPRHWWNVVSHGDLLVQRLLFPTCELGESAQFE